MFKSAILEIALKIWVNLAVSEIAIKANITTQKQFEKAH